MPHDTPPWIFAAGVFNLALAAFHLSFWRLFSWPRSLSDSGALNRSVTQILNLAVTYLFVLSALVCLLFPSEVAATPLGHFWLAAMAGFWLARALIQPPFFGLRHPLSVVLFAVFIVGAIIHGTAWTMARGI
jgi:hypothetical protein